MAVRKEKDNEKNPPNKTQKAPRSDFGRIKFAKCGTGSLSQRNLQIYANEPCVHRLRERVSVEFEMRML